MLEYVGWVDMSEKHLLNQKLGAELGKARFEKVRRELGATEALLDILEPIDGDERRERVLAAAAIMTDVVDMEAVHYVLMRIRTD